MKKVFISLLVILSLALLGTGGYYLVKTLLHEEKPMGTAVEVSGGAESSDPGGMPATANIYVPKAMTTDADVLDAIQTAYRENQDTVGWLSIPDTEINGSVLQSFDNAYYLRRNESKKEDVYGCYFADYTCNFGSRQELSTNTVIYGHSNLRDDAQGPRFSQLFKYTDQEFARSHPTIRFATADEVMEWEVFAVCYADTSFDYIQSSYTGAAFAQLVQDAKARSIYHYAVEVGAQDKILTLSTCTVKYGAQEKEQRFVVFARLLPATADRPTTAALEPNPTAVQPTL